MSISISGRRVWLLLLFALLLVSPVIAQVPLTQLCGQGGIQARAFDFQPGGIIWTMFDSSGVWVYDIGSNRRYPLPETRPCGSNCRLSPDARWMTYPDGGDFIQMRLDGTQRTPIAQNASDVEWWSADTLLVWTTEHAAYLQPRNDGTQREDLDVAGVASVQPGGRWGLAVVPAGDGFMRVLVDLETRTRQIALAPDTPYFNASAWSPNGAWLAYSAPGLFDANAGIAGAELFGIQPGDSAPRQLTDLNSLYGAVRVSGQALGRLSWSPDGTRIAFWVIELLGADVLTNTGSAMIHILDINSRALTAYCGFSTNEHTPNPPRLIWSPDASFLAFAGNVPGDERGYLLLALNTTTGDLTELSEGVFPLFGGPEVIAWGLAPG
ncbi:MAG: PD40 domain-containing protein [Chloroflexi bacterium]|nr:PD40 domain-containing protein [Chloroflexota bacterium]